MTDENDKGAESRSDESEKIHIDEDWKAQAAAEKERLAGDRASGGRKPAVDPRQPGADAPGSPPKEQPVEEPADEQVERTGPLPEASFALLVTQWATQAWLGLGEIENPVTHKRQVDLAQAKLGIDLLGVLEAKTKGNLEPQEKQLLDSALFELRMRYLDAAK